MGRHRDFWNKEYQTSEHLALSRVPSEDLEKFTRFLERGWKREFLNPRARVLDLGTGNGRNLVHLAENFGMPGTGYDISDFAIREAVAASKDLPIEYEVRSIEEPLLVPDESQTLVLDMMTSHFLKRAERERLRDEILRVLRHSGWLFFKSHLAEDDLNVKRLLRDHPADEEGAYIHPKMGVYEYVWTEDSAREFFGPYFEIHKIHKSHKHLRRGRAGKRRTLSMYLQKF
ncbi:MAG: class I SAM-dependent methyltransferase [Candidatus Kaiserbacteria bacterium]|nr:class I SAM-dependent methyltransferase [Candidatus Kaiserbacteria bacterium]